MTVFGAREKSERKVGGKPRFLGLLLTAALLLLLAGVAAWASVFLDDGLARFFREDSTEATEFASLPASEPAASTAEAASDAPEPTQVAALETSSDATRPAEGQPAALSEPAQRRAMTPDEAEATYAATGIWQRAPTAPLTLQPGRDDASDIYLLSLDGTVTAHDAVALPAASDWSDDAPYAAPMPPAPADTVFDLDDRGLVRATPEGAISPDRVRLYAGLPPAVPPNRASVLPAGASATEDAAAVESLQRLSRLRPRNRPVTLVEDNERATFGGASLSELAALRPNLRPETAKAAAEEDTTATERAVEESRAPMGRPRDFASIVEAARERQAAAETQPQQVAAVAPRTVSPSSPSSAAVAKQATVRNALNLRRVNLIGVYGQPSNRRALVRLANGRYQKVKVGDRIDGGRVAAIGEDELRYVKSGRNVTLEMP